MENSVTSAEDLKAVGGLSAETKTPPVSTKTTVQAESNQPVEVSMKSLLEAGVHFGHQTSRWNPTMAPYIFSARNGIHIINLPKTVQLWQKARKEIVETVAHGGRVLFVGTKRQAQEAIVYEAKRCGAFYVSQRWLGGMITNFQTIRKSIDRMKKIEETLKEEENLIKLHQPQKFTKKERLMMSRELEKLEFSLGGIREMTSPPQLIFVVDIKKEDIAIKEAHRLDVPVVALVDTNCDPGKVDHPIPSNDDGKASIKLFCAAIADAIIEGNKLWQANPVQHKTANKKEFVKKSIKLSAKALENVKGLSSIGEVDLGSEE